MPRVINFEGRKITVPDDATDDEVASILQGEAAPEPKTSQTLGFEQGVGNFMGNFADMAGKVPGVASAFQSVFGHSLSDSTNALRNPAHAPGEVPGKIGRFAGDVLESAPLAALAPTTLPGALAAGAVTGAATADPGHQVAGATLGAGLGGTMQAIGRAIAPQISEAVQRLAARGVTMTPGQVFQGPVKGLEDRLAGFWPLDSLIGNAKRQSLRDFGTGAGNIAMGGIGPIPPGVSGQAMSTTAHRLFDDAYDQVLPQMSVTLDPAFAQTVGNAGDTVASRLPAEYGDQFNRTIADVFKKMGAGDGGPVNTFPGRAAKDAYSDLGFEARNYQKPTATPNDTRLGEAYGQVQEGLRNAFQSDDPYAGAALQHIDTAYRGFIPVDNAIKNASGNAGGLEAGVFTPGQLRQSVVNADNSVRKVASAQGGPELQQYAEDGINVLPSSIGSSGTSERAGLLALPALGAAAVKAPITAAALAATPLLYTRPALRGFNALYAHGSSPGATALGGLMQQLGRFGSGPAASTFTGGGR